MRYTFIVNPTAGGNRASKYVPRLRQIAADVGLDHEVLITERPRHAVHLAFEAAQRSDALVAVGGDGTLLEVATGLLASDRPVPLGILPLGSGNDFVRTLRAPRDPDLTLRALADATASPIDYGIVRWWEGHVGKRSLFLNAAGLGFDAHVAELVPRYKYLPGLAGYLAAVLHALAGRHTPVASIRAGTRDEPGETLYEGPLLFAAIGNGISAGGGFCLTPDALPDDGALDCCLVARAGTLRILQLLPGALKGKHVSAPEVHMHRTSALTIRTEAPLPLHADGEPVSASTSLIEITIVPRGLNILQNM